MPNPPAQRILMTSSSPRWSRRGLVSLSHLLPPVQEWGGVEVLSSGSAEGRYEQENHPGTEVQLLSALKVSNPCVPRPIGGQVLSSVH
jgi:hypothetical protein